MRGDWKWYITIEAVRQWMQLTGRRGALEDDNPDFVAAQNELGDLSRTATLADGATSRQESGTKVYRGKVTVKGRRVRAECYVRPLPGPEGNLPQLVRVCKK